MATKLTTLDRLTEHIQSRLQHGGHVTKTAAGALANLINLLAADEEGREILAVYLRVWGYTVTAEPEPSKPSGKAPTPRARRRERK
jgi:hypothetical protein